MLLQHRVNLIATLRKRMWEFFSRMMLSGLRVMGQPINGDRSYERQNSCDATDTIPYRATQHGLNQLQSRTSLCECLYTFWPRTYGGLYLANYLNAVRELNAWVMMLNQTLDVLLIGTRVVVPNNLR
jgi:hypothetical protein